LLAEDLLWVEDPEKKERVRVVGGELRKRDVVVATHVAVKRPSWFQVRKLAT